MAAKKFYWLKMKEDFFSPMGEDQTMAYLMDMDDGYAYVVTYIALLLASLKGDGVITRYIGDKIVRHDARSLARATGMDLGVMTQALPIFEELGLIQWTDAGEVVMCRIGEMIGTETQAAIYKRQQRTKSKADNETAVDDVNQDSGHAVDNVHKAVDNVHLVSKKCQTEIEKEIKSKSNSVEIKKVPAGKPADVPVPDGVDLDEELPFDDRSATNPAMDSSIKAVVEAWNRMVVLVRETEGKNLGTVQSLSPDSDRYIMLYNLLSRGPYMADLMVACIQAIPQVDVWIHPKDPRYEDWKPSFVWLLENWDGKVFRRMEQMGVIKPVMAGGSVTYEVGNTAASGDSAKQKPAFDFGIDFG